VDGEAVSWAAQRLVQRHDGRRLLLVISDGSPTDGATALGQRYPLPRSPPVPRGGQLEAQGEVEIYGIGVGLDLSPYYRHNRALRFVALGHQQAVLREIVAMLA
jgi:cobaltochelatase CobT